VTPRRFPPPWTIDEANNACFIVRDGTGQAIAYVYFEVGHDRKHDRDGMGLRLQCRGGGSGDADEHIRIEPD
jgi:hypothetical protein